MRIIGVDPGVAHTGYGIIDTMDSGSRVAYVASGVITTSPGDAFTERLSLIYDAIKRLITCYEPGCLAIEEVFFAKNVRTALLLGQVRGVVLLSAARSGIPVFPYSATAIKVALCRFGRSDKHQVKSMVRMLLQVKGSLSNHAADALAVGICHAHTHGLRARLAQGAGASCVSAACLSKLGASFQKAPGS